MNLAQLEQKLRAASHRPVGLGAIERAARRAADSTNAALRQAHVPARAEVRKHGKGMRVVLVQTGRIDRPFTGRTPKQLLADNVRREMQVARAEVAAEARRSLQ